MNSLSKMSASWTLAFLCLLPLSSFAQGVSINNSGKKAHPSAMIDISSSKKGLLTPRMSTQERLAISQPADGLLVYDTDTDGFWYYSNPVTTTDTAGISTTSGGWMALIPGNHDDAISDSDSDTGIQTEESADDDIIRFDIADKEKMALMSNSNGIARLELYDPNNNMFLGNDAGQTVNTNSTDNLAIGARAGAYMSHGIGNTLIGHNAGSYLSYPTNSNEYNVFVGYESGTYSSGSANTAVGYQSAHSGLPLENTMLGYQAGQYASSLASVHIGTRSGQYASSSAGTSVTIGNYSGRYTEGGANIFIGFTAGEGNSTSPVSGGRNLGIGYQAAKNLADGRENVIIGAGALDLGTGDENVIIGEDAMGSTFYAGTNNVAIGHQALFKNDTGDNNTSVGSNTGYNNGGDYNCFLGHYAGYNNKGFNNNFIGRHSGYGNIIGHSNAFFGAYSGYHNTIGKYNSFIGHYGGYIHKLGSYNSSLGLYAGSNSSSATYNYSTAIGSYSRYTASHQVRVGRSSTSSIGGYQAWTNLSDGRFKQDIQEDVPGLDFVMQLRPITYKVDIEGLDRFIEGAESLDDPELAKEYDKELAAMRASSDAGKIVHSGFVAQEVEETAKQLGYAFSGVDRPQNEQDHYGLRYATFVVPLVKAVQEQQTLIQQQQIHLQQQKEMMEGLQAEIEALKQLIRK